MKILRFLPLIGIVLFAYIVWETGIEKILESFHTINLFYVLISIGFILIVLLLRALRWKLIIRAHEFDESVLKCGKLLLIGLFTGIITPGKIGDAARAFYLDKNQSFGKRLSTVIVDRMVDIIVTIIFALIGILLLNELLGYTVLSFWLIAGFCAAFFIGLYLLTKKSLVQRLIGPIFNFFVPEKHKKGMSSTFHDFYSAVGKLKKKRFNLFVIIIFTVIIWLLTIVEILFFGLILGISFDYWFMLSVISITAIIEIIPISVSGLGTREAFWLVVLPFIGMTSGTIISFSLVYLFFGIWLWAFIGFLLWLKNPLKLEL